MNRRKHLKDLLFFGAALLLLVIMLYSGFRILESTVFYRAPVAVEESGTKTIVRDGVSYFPKQDMTVVMVLGIDRYGPAEPSVGYTNRGAADVVMLLAFDEKNEVINVLHLNRDSMVDMPVLGFGGKQAGTLHGQLALSHTYGTGVEDSCENTRKTVSNLLYGLQIDHYVSLNMDAISLINDAVGGVSVNVTEDFSSVDPSITQGEVTLKGDQALNFIRTRKDVGDQLNVSRMQRQREYINGFSTALRQRQKQDSNFMMDVYQQIQPYMVTDCTINAVNGMSSRYSDYAIGEVVIPAGENVVGEEYMEFHLDEEALDEVILRLFYAPKK